MSDVEIPKAEAVRKPKFFRARLALTALRKHMRTFAKYFAVPLGLCALLATVGLFLERIYVEKRQEAEAGKAKRQAECLRQTYAPMDDIVRIKLMGDGARRVYRQTPGSKEVTSERNICDVKFLADLPAGAPMRAETRPVLSSGGWCECETTFHIHSITDPNVE